MAEKKLGGAGLRGQSAGSTALCTVGKTGAGLTYRGYDMVELAEKASFEEVAYTTLHSTEGRCVMGRGFFNSPLPYGTMAWSFDAQVAEVKVDPETGQIQVLKVTVAHDLGRAINPLAVEGQIDGQVFSAMSQVIYEELVTDDGLFLNPSRLEYKMPRSYEMPEISHHLIETIDPYGPFGAKEVGEGPVVVAGAAIIAAVSNALGGVLMTEMPMTPLRVLKAIRASGLDANAAA